MEKFIVFINEEGVHLVNIFTLESADFIEGLLKVLDCDRIRQVHLKPSEYSLASEENIAKVWWGRYKYGIKVVVKNIFGATIFDDQTLGSAVITMNVENEDGSIGLTPFPSENDAQFFIDNYLDAHLLTFKQKN